MLAAAERHVAILMAVYAGERYLPQQLQSFAQQTHRHWSLHVSIDGESLASREILQEQAEAWRPLHDLTVKNGPGRGFAANFISLIQDPEIKADYYACSDQDDIWLPDKLARAVMWLDAQPAGQPALYCSRTELIDENNNSLGLSIHFKRPPSFANALVQNIAGGNTMVFNQRAKDLLCLAPDADVPFHDWWIYQTVTACGGSVRFDPVPTLLYRQHTGNVIGANGGWRSRLKRLRALLQGEYRALNDKNLVALASLEPDMSDRSRTIYQYFINGRQKVVWLWRVYSAFKSGVYKQHILANLGLWLGILFNKN